MPSFSETQPDESLPQPVGREVLDAHLSQRFIALDPQGYFLL